VIESPHEEVEVKYSDYYVAFLDVLGFSDLISKSKDREHLKTISGYYTQVKRAFQTLDSSWRLWRSRFEGQQKP